MLELLTRERIPLDKRVFLFEVDEKYSKYSKYSFKLLSIQISIKISIKISHTNYYAVTPVSGVLPLLLGLRFHAHLQKAVLPHDKCVRWPCWCFGFPSPILPSKQLWMMALRSVAGPTDFSSATQRAGLGVSGELSRYFYQLNEITCFLAHWCIWDAVSDSNLQLALLLSGKLDKFTVNRSKS